MINNTFQYNITSSIKDPVGRYIIHEIDVLNFVK